MSISIYGQNQTIEYRVKKGDNVYRLSLKYGVSTNDIYQLNPGARDLIRIGEILRIPVNSEKKADNADDETVINYTVKKGETKFGLSRKYGISIAELEKSNPIIINGLQAGHKLKITPKNTSKISDESKSNSHKVLKGETLWGISRRYNMSLDELRRLNADILGKVLLEGQVLKVTTDRPVIRDNTYVVKRGDTKYGLARRFKTSISELERLNPSIVDMLMAGDVIVYAKLSEDKKSEDKNPVVDKDIDTNTTSEDRTIDSEYNWYIIKPKETLYSISKKTNMTITALTNLNPKLKQNVMAGDSIKIIGPIPKDIDVPEPTKIVKNKFKTNIFWKSMAFQPNNDKVKIAADYFRGLQSAVTEISKEQSVMDTQIKISSDADSVFSSFQFEPTEKFLLKPMPQFAENKSQLGKFELRYLKNDTPVTQSIVSLASQSIMRMKMLAYLNAKDANVICLYDNENANNISDIKNMLSEEITLIKLNRNGTFKPNDLKANLQSNRKNYVIIESDKIGVFLSASTLLLRELSEHDIQLAVLNHENIPQESQVSVKRFQILKLVYPLPFNPNFMEASQLERQIGYMVNYDILNRLSNEGGEAFEKIVTNVLGTTFNYVLEGNTLKNTAVSIYSYSENSKAVLLETF